MTHEPAAFDVLYQPHLDRVSRSFALCIRELHEPLRSWTALAYLLCRLLDTVEDAPWTDPAAQARSFEGLNGYLLAPPSQAEAKAWAAGFPTDLPLGEALLLQDSHALYSALHALPRGPKEAIAGVARRMSEGMGRYAQAWAHQGSLALLDLEDVNRYCYFVAGVVGELLTRLFVLSRDDFVAPAKMWLNAQHFGLFLQKVNLLKDQKKDEGEGRFLCPNRQQLRESLPAHALGALGYVTALPKDDSGRAFRIFCAWSMFLGAASLPFIEADYGAPQGASHKIGRAQTQALMQHIAAMACDDAALAASLQGATALMQPPLPTETSAPLTAKQRDVQQSRRRWFNDLCHGPLSRQDLSSLGMAPPP